MENQINKRLISVFEQIKHTDDNGNEFWMARQLAKALEYTDFRNFISVIEKAKDACNNSGQLIGDHLAEVNEEINHGKGAVSSYPSYMLSRYACYLIVQNADPKKQIVALGQTYFANQKPPKIYSNRGIRDVIYTIDGQQVILDRDLAKLYQTDTRTLKQAVKRNQDRFPTDFMFELSDVQINILVSQLVIPSKSYFGGAKPFAFTELGVAMLSAVLRTPVAVEISLQIIRAFVEMRKLLINNTLILQRIDRIEIQQIETELRFERVFKALEEKNNKPERGVFYKDAVFDAYSFVCDIIRNAQTSIILIDNYVDDTVLTLLSKRKSDVEVVIYTPLSKHLELDLNKHNTQYPVIKIKTFNDAHDRFLIIDGKEMYHIGASLKDLGKKWFAFSRMDSFVNDVLLKLKRGVKNE